MTWACGARVGGIVMTCGFPHKSDDSVIQACLFVDIDEHDTRFAISIWSGVLWNRQGRRGASVATPLASSSPTFPPCAAGRLSPSTSSTSCIRLLGNDGDDSEAAVGLMLTSASGSFPVATTVQ